MNARRGREAMTAVALAEVLADPEAPLALVHLGRESADDEVRAQAHFWLAQSGEPRAARWIREAIERLLTR